MYVLCRSGRHGTLAGRCVSCFGAGGLLICWFFGASLELSVLWGCWSLELLVLRGLWLSESVGLSVLLVSGGAQGLWGCRSFAAFGLRGLLVSGAIFSHSGLLVFRGRWPLKLQGLWS